MLATCLHGLTSRDPLDYVQCGSLTVTRFVAVRIVPQRAVGAFLRWNEWNTCAENSISHPAMVRMTKAGADRLGCYSRRAEALGVDRMHLRKFDRRLISNTTSLLRVVILLATVAGSALFVFAMEASATIDPAFRDLVIFATDKVTLKANAQIISGDVVVNADLDPQDELIIGEGATTSAGSDLKADTIRVRSGATVNGNVFFNSLNNSGTINGTQNSGLALPVFNLATEIPVFQPGTPGGMDVTVPRNGSETITPGDYGDIVIRIGGTLNFAGAGTYDIRSIRAARNSSLLFYATDDVEVRVAEKLNVGRGSTVGPKAVTSIDASNIIFYVEDSGGRGPTAATFGGNSDIDATIYVSLLAGKLGLGAGTNATGAFYASQVTVGENVLVTFDGFFGIPPVLTAGSTLIYTENDAATAIDTTITVNDLDDTDLESATGEISANYANGEDLLAFVDAAPIIGSFNAGTGTLTLTGTDSLANYQTALRAVTYENNSDDPSTLSRTVTSIGHDGEGDSAPVTRVCFGPCACSSAMLITP